MAVELNNSPETTRSKRAGRFADLFEEALAFRDSDRDVEMREADALDGASSIGRLPAAEARYDIHDVIAVGGMKRILRATDYCTDRIVAMAVIKQLAKPAIVDRFVREARIAALLEHPNIIPVYDVGLDEEGRPFFTMKLVSGRTLQTIIDKLNDGDPDAVRDFPLSQLLEIFLSVCNAVAYAHSKGVLHLDLKPDNVQVSDYGEVLLCDWGLARCLENDTGLIAPPAPQEGATAYDDVRRFTTTVDGEVCGTPGYMAREQAVGSNSQRDRRTDVYALGAILYAILTYERPYAGMDLMETLEMTINGVLPPPRQLTPRHIPPGLEAICLKAMAGNPEERYPTVPEMTADVHSFLRGYPTSAEDAGFLVQLRLFIRRNQRACLFLAGTILVLGAVVAAFVTRLKISEGQARTAEAAARSLVTQLQKAESAGASAEKARAAAVAQQQQLMPDAVETMLTRASDLLTDHHVADAHAAIDMALALQPDNENAQLLLVDVFIARFRFGEAIALMDTLAHKLAENPDNINIPGRFTTFDLVSQYAAKLSGDRLGGDDLLEFLRELTTLGEDHMAHLILSSPELDNMNLDERSRAAIFMMPLLNSGNAALELNNNAETGLLDAVVTGNDAEDIFALYGLPIGSLDLRRAHNVTEIGVITRLPLRRLYLAKTDPDYLEEMLTAISKCRGLKQLHLPQRDRRRIADGALAPSVRIIAY